MHLPIPNRQMRLTNIHTRIACHLLVEGSVPPLPFEHRIPIVWLQILRTLLLVRTHAPFRGIECCELRHPYVYVVCPKTGLPSEDGVTKYLFFPRPLRFTRVLLTPRRSTGYAVRRVWFCFRTSPDILPAGGWHSHSGVWWAGSLPCTDAGSRIARWNFLPIPGFKRTRSSTQLPGPGPGAASKAHFLHDQSSKIGSLDPYSNTTIDSTGLYLPPPV